MAEDIKQIIDEPQFTFLEMLETLPDPVKEYLLSSDLDQIRIKIFDDLKLSLEDRETALFTELSVIFSDVSLEDYPDALWSNLPWEESEKDRAKQLVIEVAGQIFMPIASYLGDVAAVLTRFGADPKKYEPAKKIQVQRLSFTDGVTDILQTAKITDLDDATERRLRGIIESRLRGERDDEATKNILTRATKVGGLEMIDADADELVKLIAEKMKATVYFDVAKSAPAAAVESARSAVSPAPEAPAKIEKKPLTPAQIKERLVGSADDQKQLAAAVQKVSQDNGNNLAMIGDSLYKLATSSEAAARPLDLVAAVMLLAQHGQLINLLAKDARYQEMVKSKISDQEIPRREPAGWAAMNVFLQTLLRNAARLSDEDAARYGFRVVSLLKKLGEAQYSDLVAFDLDAEKFIWTAPI